jgi:hypothetical protein
LVQLSARIGLERLCEQVLAEHDYDPGARPWDGSRRFANLQLGRLARVRSDRGGDLAGLCGCTRAGGGRAGGDAVSRRRARTRFASSRSTLPRGSSSRSWSSRTPDAIGSAAGGTIVALSDGRFGFRMVHPRGERRSVSTTRTWDAGASRACRRLPHYVAMTRAIDRLIVWGDRPRAGGRSRDADRLGPRAARRRRERRRRGDDPVEPSAAMRASSCASGGESHQWRRRTRWSAAVLRRGAIMTRASASIGAARGAGRSRRSTTSGGSYSALALFELLVQILRRRVMGRARAGGGRGRSARPAATYRRRRAPAARLVRR